MRPLGRSTSTINAAPPEGINLPLEIRVHGRGGQGGVTCAKLIAALYARMGLSVQTFGDYGSERSGAPVQAFTRVDRIPITNRNKVYRPDQLLVLDAGLLETPVLSGVAPGSLILLNSTASPADLGARYHGYRVATVDATEIARERGIGSSSVVIINTTIVGAYARLLGIPLDLLADVYASLGVPGDIAAAKIAYERVQIQEPFAAETCGEAFAPQAPAPTSTAPITEPAQDFPINLKTGLWSNQSPSYCQYTAPCNAACPAGNDVVGFIQALKDGGPEAAAAVLLQTQALPSVCGRVCPAPCMSGCNRTAFDGAVNIRSLERWIADHSNYVLERVETPSPRRFAIVGGGPAGLSAAYQLALHGHHVTIYEAAPALGGVLRYGIPAFRLPLDVLDRDIARIIDLGVTARCESPVDAAGLTRLAAEYDALIVCTGFGAYHSLGVPGEELPGVEQGLPFLERAKAGTETVTGHVVVVGGGNSAIDCARSALRLGAASVRIVYRRSREDMPAIVEEIAEAELEGIRLATQRQPVACLGDDRINALVLAEVEAGKPDASGRCRPVVTDRTATVPCDRIILALGQQNGLDFLPAGWRVEEGRAIDGGATLPVFFAGDCATGEGTVTHAIGNGHRSALAALAALERGNIVTATAADETAVSPERVVAPAQIRFSHFEPDPPGKDRHLPLNQAREGFGEFNLGLAGPEEANRCFSCGRCTKCDTCLIYCPDGIIHRTADGYRVDLDHCKGCGMCVAECPRSAMEMNDKALPGGSR